MEAFHPLIRQWFARRYGDPTEIQRLAWPRIASGGHVLLTAPTGSGKTLTAFLWALDRLVSGAWEPGATRVLYVSPLKALNNDIRRNLLEPLDELRREFEAAGQPSPDVKVATRSGDTPARERRQMVRRPPEILITTPESLNILLTSGAGAVLFPGLQTVVLDEVHAIAGGKRGTHLITAVERLTRLSGEFQRLALSATVHPVEQVARWVGGWRHGPAGVAEAFVRREVEVVRSRAPKAYDFSVRTLDTRRLGDGNDTSGTQGSPYWDAVAEDVESRIHGNRSTLVFANSRRAVEKVARLVNERAGQQLVYSHHGSLSRELREVVEARLKAGQLAGIVATNSLELGIDIGAVDEVVLVQSPPSLTSAVQRVGRAGHGVGQVSRAVLYPSHPRDLLDAAVMATSLGSGEVEPVVPPEAPLDVLAQVLLSMVTVEPWQVDDLYDAVRCAAPYRDLSRDGFERVLAMLSGRYAGSRIGSLRPRIAWDRVEDSVRARPGVARLLYAAGGTIPDRGYFTLRLEGAGKGARLGELDEEFVWERSVGEVFTLGVQSWRVQRISHNDVFVTPAGGGNALAPFWRAEERARTNWFATRVGAFLEQAEETLAQDSVPPSGNAFPPQVSERLDEPAVLGLAGFLERQRGTTGCGLPHRHHLVVELTTDPDAGAGRGLLILHTIWGGTVNRPLAIALGAAWQERFGEAVQVVHDDDCVVLQTEDRKRLEPLAGDGGTALLRLVQTPDLERLLRGRLEGTGFFGARFRENAGRALLLPRAGFARRTPLWVSRQRAKDLLDAVSGYDDFPILLETWRACLRDEMELGVLGERLDEIEAGRITVSAVTTPFPSPFASEALWRRTNHLMYEDDVPGGGSAGSNLRSNLVREVAGAARLRPQIPGELSEQLRRRLQRTQVGYAPTDAGEVVEWVKERTLIPMPEWQELLAAVERDHGIDPGAVLESVAGRIVAVHPPQGKHPLICSVEGWTLVVAALGLIDPVPLSPRPDGGPAAPEARKALRELAGREVGPAPVGLEGILGEWLQFQVPVDLAQVADTFGLAPGVVEDAAAVLAGEDRVVVDELTEDACGAQLCDRANLERLLRWERATRRGEPASLPAQAWPLFQAHQQGLGGEGSPGADLGDGVDRLREAMDGLFGFPAPAGAWESDILPARVPGYRTAMLDALIADSPLEWFGCGEGLLGFRLEEDRDVIPGHWGDVPPRGPTREDLEQLLPEEGGRYSLTELVSRSGLRSGELTRRLWAWAWQGRVSNTGYSPVRQGVQSGFQPADTASKGPIAGARPARGGSRRGFGRWRSSRPFGGSWYALGPFPDPADAVEREDLRRERARLVLDRYGIVFRELLAREAPALRWGELVRTLQILELGGECVGGWFVQGPTGLQFASPDALEALRSGFDEDRVFWINAADPASPCGLGLEGLELPRRLRSTHLVYAGRQLALVSERSGAALDIRVPPDDPRLGVCLGALKVLMTRDSQPLGHLTVETINGDGPLNSPYRPTLEGLFEVSPGPSTLRVSPKHF